MKSITAKIPKQVVYLGLVSLFTDFASEMLYPVTPLFLAGVLGSSMAVIGIIEGLAEVTAALLKGYFGLLSDKLKKRSPFVSAGYSVSALSKPLPGLFPVLGVVVTSRVLDRIGKGVRTAPRDALLAGYGEGNQGSVFGFHRSMDTIGAILGPIAAIVLLNIFNNNFQLIFILAFIPSIIAAGLTFIIKDKGSTQKPAARLFDLSFWKEAPPLYRQLVILTAIFSFANSSDVFLILRFKEVSASDTTAIAGYIFYNVVYAAISYPAGILADKSGKKNIYIFGLFLFSIVYLGFALVTNFYFMFALFGLYGIYAAATEGILKAWISDIIPDSRRASAIGLLVMISGLMVMAGSTAAGILWDQFGSTIPFLFSAVISIIVALLLIRIKK
jgi:MFS family permease